MALDALSNIRLTSAVPPLSENAELKGLKRCSRVHQKSEHAIFIHKIEKFSGQEAQPLP